MTTLDDEMKAWAPAMELLLGKEKWASLNYYQRMCEIIAVKEASKRPMLGFDLF